MHDTIDSKIRVFSYLVAGLLLIGAPGTIRAESGATTVIKAPAVADSTAAAPDAGSVTFNSLTGATPPASSSPGEITLGAKSYTATEGLTRKIVVKRVFGTKGAVSVNYVTKSKTAIVGQDFVLKKGTLTWANGDAADKIVKVKILQDGVAESNEVFLFQLNTPVGLTLIAPTKATVTIASNDVPVLVGASAAFSDPLAGTAAALAGDSLAWFLSAVAPESDEVE